jgi:hypothetical protein
VTARAHISVKTRVDVAIRQAWAPGVLVCPLCPHALTADDERVLEHMTPHEFTKDNSVENLAWVHKACALKKTNGKAHVKVDGDLSKIAKAKRLAAGGRKRKGRAFPTKQNHKWPSRSFPKRVTQP